MRTRFLSITPLSVSFTCAIAAFACASLTHAETLLVDRVKQERDMGSPNRGMTMAQVERTFGAPKDKLAAAGGDAPRHPVINRWVYDRYIVYFERNRVISSVAVRATPNEIGPKDASSNQ
ncbi:MAG: hypothetical protein ABLQ96_02075 [Candidatus Acidiferrum sp.]